MSENPAPNDPAVGLVTRTDPLLAATVALQAVSTGLQVIDHFKGGSPPPPPQEPPPPQVELPPGVDRE